MSTFNDWILKAQALGLQEKNSVVALHTALEQSSARNLSHELRILRQADILAVAERISESRKVKQHLDQLFASVHQLEQHLLSNADIKTIEAHAQALDKHLYGARKGWEEANNSLLSREEELRNAIAQAELRFTTLETISARAADNTSCKPSTKRGSSAPVHSQRPFARNLRPRALQLIEEEMEQLGGRTGGWDSEDHDRFYSYWLSARKRVDRHAFIHDIQGHFPLHTLGALLAHDEFVARYVELNERRKRYIQHWRANQASNLNEIAKVITVNADAVTGVTGRSIKSAHEKRIAKNRIQALQERKNMELEDNLALALRRKRRQQQEAREAKLLLRRRAATAAVKKASLAAAYEEKNNAEQHGVSLSTNMAAKEIDLEVRRKRKLELEAMKRRHQEQIRAAAERHRQQEELNHRASSTSRDIQLAENAKRVQSSSVQQIERDPARIFQPTAAMVANKKALEEAKKRRESGGQGLTIVTQGFDPFDPFLGGIAQPTWMQ